VLLLGRKKKKQHQNKSPNKQPNKCKPAYQAGVDLLRLSGTCAWGCMDLSWVGGG